MGLPSNWKTRRSSIPSDNDEEPIGHQDQGGTICLHSLAVAPEFQKMGLGTVLMKSYIQRMKDSKIADRIALLAHDHLVPFYQGLGFDNMGPSAVTSHGGNWNNMVSFPLQLNYEPTS
jgi:predicted N-acetyltransferase YhbS